VDPIVSELRFLAPARILVGAGCRMSLPRLLADDGRTRPLVVVDPRIGDAAALRDVLGALALGGVAPPMCRDVTGEPYVETAEGIAARLRDGQHDAVIAIGGGSVIDAAKGAAIGATNPGGLVTYEGFDRFEHLPLPVYALPTTAGTGSEVTRVTVLGASNPTRKISIKSARLVPTAALVDPDFLASVPPRVAAAAATDALTHALEAYLRPASSPVSRALGIRAATQILRVMRRGRSFMDAPGLTELATGSMLAGLAFGNSDVGPVHCLAESIGAVYKAPHGAANAVFLGPVLNYYGQRVHAALAEVARHAWPERVGAMTDDAASRALVDAVNEFVDGAGIESMLAQCGGSIDVDLISKLAETNNSNASGPMPMSATHYAEIIRGML
jgi:alcohol dehydrogenase class IV